MKKFIQYSLFVALSAIFLSACSTRQSSITPQVSRTDITGTWTVSTVALEGFPAGYSVGSVFDIANYQSFEGSTWTLRGNYTGTISLNNGTSQEIHWSINKDGAINRFQFKKLMPGEKPKNVTSGYRLEFGDITKNSAVFKTPVAITGGQIGYINFTFTKS